MLLAESFELFINDKTIDVVDSTIETMCNRFKIIDKYFFGKENEYVTKNKVREFQKYLLNDCDYSVSHTNHIIGLLKQIYRFLNEQGFIKVNDIANIGTIKKQIKIVAEKVIWDIVQYNKFSENIINLRDKLIFDMLFFLGLRKGELISLKWNEVCFANKTIRILSTASRKKGVGQVVTPPKTVNSNRLLSLNESLYIMLYNYYNSLKTVYGGCVDDWYVVGDIKMMSFTSLQRLLNEYLLMTTLPKITLHGFRHSHATMLFSLTKDIKAISLHLGHESIEVTINTYIHSTDKAQRELAELVEDNLQAQNKTQFEVCKQMIEKLLAKEMTDKKYSNNELDCLVNTYNYIRKEMISF